MPKRDAVCVPQRLLRALTLWNQAGAVIRRKRPENAEQERKRYAATCRRE